MGADTKEIVARRGCAITDEHIFFQPDIPPARLLSALKAYAEDVEPETVLSLVDNTLGGGAKDGVLLTDTHLYAHSMWQKPVSIALIDIETVLVDSGKVLVNGMPFVDISFPSREAILAFTRMLEEIAGSFHPQASVAAPAEALLGDSTSRIAAGKESEAPRAATPVPLGARPALPEVRNAEWMRPYRFSGACPARASWAMLAVAAGGGIAIGFAAYWGGWLVFWLTYAGMHVAGALTSGGLVGKGVGVALMVIVVLSAALGYPLLIGSGVGSAVAAVGQYGKCRNIGVATAFGLLGGLVAWGALALTGLLAGGAVQESSRILAGFESVRAALTPAVLVIDAALVVFGSVRVTRVLKDTPFCESCGEWYVISKTTKVPVATATLLVDALAAGSVASLVPADSGDPALQPIALQLQRCACGSVEAVLTADVNWVEQEERRGKIVMKRKTARWFQTALPAELGNAVDRVLFAETSE
jgi:hypothetical protein